MGYSRLVQNCEIPQLCVLNLMFFFMRNDAEIDPKNDDECECITQDGGTGS